MSQRRLLLVDLFAHTGAGAEKLNYASEDFVGGAIDPYVAGTWVDGRVSQPGLLQRAMYRGGGTRGDINIDSGVIQLANADGALDPLWDYAFDGQPWKLWDYSAYTGVVHAGVDEGAIEQATFSDDKITFNVRSFSHVLDEQLLANVYLGNNSLPNGIEGTANDIKGQSKPLCAGINKNITPVLVNTSKLIYQVDGQRGLLTGFSITVYDKRSALTRGADYTSQTDMQNNAPSAGQYRVWPSGGCFRLGSSPIGQITADVTNPADLSVGSTFCEVSSVLSLLANQVIEQALTDDCDCGIYLTEPITRLNAMSMVARSVNGCLRWLTNFPGSGIGLGFLITQLTEPASLPYTPDAAPLELDEDSILSINRVVPADTERGIPVGRVTVNYAKNYTVMTPTDLAGVALADQNFCSREYRSAVASVALPAWPHPTEFVVDSLLATEADAQAEADRLLALHSVRRDTLVVTIPGEVARSVTSAVGGPDPYIVTLQSQVTVTYPRFGLDAGKTFLVIGMTEDHAADTFELTLWG